MANIMSLVKLQNKPSRNAFDLSRKVAFSAKIAELLPFECIECIPGDSFKIRKQHFTRTLPVNTAAYTRVREYYDWFFVPTNLLWNKFNTFVTQMADNNQKAVSISEDASTGVQHPYFTTTDIVSYISRFQTDQEERLRNFFGYNRPMLTAKLLDYLGYGQFYGAVGGASSDYPSTIPSLFGNNVLNPFPLLAYQKIYQDYYRNSQWEKAYAPACNIDYMSNKNNLQLPIENIDFTAENMFDLRYANWNKDYFMGVLPNSQYGDMAEVDFSSIGSISISNIDTRPVNVPFKVNSVSNSALSVGDNMQISSRDTESTMYGVKASDSDLNLRLTADALKSIRNGLGLGGSGTFNLQQSFSILALRQAEASQKWREITQSTQQDYKSQLEAHFGVSVSDAYSDRCKFIDGHVNTIDINEVINQALGGQSSEANIKGKGVGTGDGYINFETKVHGYLMCIYHAMPILDYQTTGIKKRNLKTMVTDYVIPEYDKTGMIKMPFVELTNVRTSAGNIANSLLGYAPQYYDMKTNYDEVKGAFAYGGLGAWVSPFTQEYLNEYLTSVFNAFGNYNVEYHFFKIDPAVVNPIFTQQLDPEQLSSSETSTDQLLINCSLDIKAVRNIDRNGLPY